VVHLRTANLLGLTLSPSMLAGAELVH
jgi:hypothetical protein